MIIDEPPTETNGSGMPVIGAMPIVMPTLTKTWKRNMNDDARRRRSRSRDRARRDDLQRLARRRAGRAAAGSRRRRSRAARRARRTRSRSHARAGSRAASASRPATPRPRRPPAPTAVIDWRQVVGRAARVVVGMREAGQALAWYGFSTLTPAAGSSQSTASAAISATAPSSAEMQPAHAREEEHGGERGAVDERRADVRLDEDEQDRHEPRARSRASGAPELVDRACARSARKPARTSDEQHLAELGRLEA